jgi:hypothetical protein
MTVNKRFLATLFAVALLAITLVAMGLLLASCNKGEETTTTTAAPAGATTTSVAAAAGEKTLAAGEAWALTETTSLTSLTIGEGATITAPEGKSVTLTVDGVETGQALATTAGYDLVFVPGTYTGDVVLTVADANPVDYGGNTAQFRQAICVDETGLSATKSVLAAVLGTQPTATSAEDLSINSTGECFDGIFVGSNYAIKDVEINLSGNGRSDFSGYGAAIVASGQGTTLTVDGATIRTDGVARAGVVATNGASVVVKNSDIQTDSGELPADYVGTIDTSQMRTVPWMLGLAGNVRATNLLGTNTKASYINSRIASEGWGVLSTDGCTTPTLTAINCQVEITGEDGYGSYGIGDATENFLGCTFDVGTYATISRGSFLFYGDSDPAAVAKLNTDLGLNLTEEDLAAIPDQPTVVNSRRFGIMWHGGGTLDVSGGTVFNTKEAVFLDKGQAITITVDGSGGVELNPENGVIMQLMDDDDAGPNMAEGGATTNTYTEPTDPVTADASHDLTTAGASDAVATFSNITLTGDFYNSTRGGGGGAMGAPAGDAAAPAGGAPAGDAAAPAGAPPAGGATDTTAAGAPPADGAGAPPGGMMGGGSINLGLTFDNSHLTGVITASTAKHDQATIAPEDYKLLGKVTNTPAEAVNNGVIVVLKNASTWTVTGTSYITSLTIGEGCTIEAAAGKTLIMKVDGVEKPIAAGTFTGHIELIVQ